MIYAVAGGVVALLLAGASGASSAGLWVAGVLGALITYLGSCWLFPHTTCPWCRDRRRRSDGAGNWRDRACPTCGDRPYVRLGARFLGCGE